MSRPGLSHQFTERTCDMPKTQILVIVLIAAAVGAAVAQAPQSSLTGGFGVVVGNDVAGVVAMDHRTAPIGGQDIFVGNV